MIPSSESSTSRELGHLKSPRRQPKDPWGFVPMRLTAASHGCVKSRLCTPCHLRPLIRVMPLRATPYSALSSGEVGQSLMAGRNMIDEDHPSEMLAADYSSTAALSRSFACSTGSGRDLA